jgi:predicted thioesterase
MALTPGVQATVERGVEPRDTAAAVGSGDLPVLATPIVVALMEEAACAAIAGALPDGSTSVGIHLDVRHTAPSPVGAVVRATATLTEVDGRRLAFEVSAQHELASGLTEVAHGTHARVIVDRSTFLGRLPA